MNRSILATVLLAATLAGLPAGSARAHAPHDVVDAVAISPDYAQDRTVIAAVQLTEHRFIARSTDGGKSWFEIGTPAAEKGILSLEISPDFANDQTVFAGTLKGGVFKSIDAGNTWTEMNVGLRSPAIHQVSLSPDYANDATLFAATEVGLYRSTDGGGTWAKSSASLPNARFGVVEFADAPNIVYAAGRVLFRSLDGGQTWTALRDFRRSVKSVALSPSFTTDFTLLVSFGRATESGLFVSVDGGATFGQMEAGLTDPLVNRVAIADDGTFFAVSEAAACFRADQAFGVWTEFSDGFEQLASQTDSHFFTLDVSPTFSVDGEVFVGAHEGLFHSVDRGEHWKQRDLYHQRINRYLTLSPTFQVDGEVYAGNYGGGPFKYDDATAQWEALGHGIISLWCGALEISPTYATDGTVFYGYSGAWRSNDRGATWTKVFPGGDVTRSLAISPQYAIDTTVFLNAASLGTHKSTDGGANWTPITNLPVVRINHIRLDPQYPAVPTIFTTPQGMGILRSDDDAATWIDVSGPMAGKNVRAFELSPDFANDGVALAGSVGNGLFRTNDRGASWVPVPGLPSGGGDTIESFDFSPDYANDRTLFVVSFLDGLFRSTDDGATWLPLSAGLPDDAKRVVRVSPAFVSDQTVFLSTHDWTFRSTDAGLSWTRLPGFIRVDDRHPTVFYEGAWAKVGGGDAFGAQLTQSNVAGEEFEFEFFGSRVQWHARTDSTSGRADVYLDGALVATVDLYTPSVIDTVPVWGQSFVGSDWHTVRVVVTGQKNPQSSGFVVRSDGFLRRF